jgi:4-amino-4-deoxy-L-arabinose transferase-like glycosyltransferase
VTRPGTAGWIVAALTALALGLRLAGIQQSLFGDELFLYAAVDDHSLGQTFSVIHDTEKTPPLGFVWSWLFARGNGAPELVRLPSLAASVATVPLVYLLGVRTVGRAGGLVAAAWFALSPFEVFYGTEARSYAQVTALAVLSTLALLEAVDDRRARWWLLYALAGGAALYTHYIAVLTLVPQAAWALWRHRDTAREQLIAAGVMGLAFVPWLPSFVVQFRHSTDEAKRIAVLAPLTLSSVLESTAKALAGHPFVPLRDLPGVPALVILAAALGAALVLIRGGLEQWPRRGGLLALLALTPPAGIVLYSLRPDTSFLLARNLSVAVPYALLLAGWLLTRPRLRLALPLCLAALGAVSAGTVEALSPERQRTDGRDAARYIDANAPPGVPVVDVQYPYRGPPARGTRIYLERPHRLFGESGFPSAWAAASRARSPILVSVPRVPTLIRLFAPPSRYAPRYRLAAEHRSQGLRGILIREYVPR